MPTPFESATLILTLYEQRREETMRKARDYFVTFDPQSFDELMAGMAGPQSAYIRMVIGYWEQAASLVIHGAIDETMFREATGEYILVYARIQPYLPQIREMFGNPGFAANLEKLAMGLPNAQERLDGTLNRMRALVARSKAASAN
jgi:hypothetical protein